MSKHIAFFSIVWSSISNSAKHRARRNSGNSGQNGKRYSPLAQTETSNDKSKSAKSKSAKSKSAKSKSAKSKSAKSAKSGKSVRFADNIESDKSVPELRYRAKAAKAEHDKRRTIEEQRN